MDKHTPGPWRAHLEPNSAYVFDGDIDMSIAVVHGYPREQREANARLIAAAPRMLDLVRGLYAAGSLPLGSEKRLTAMGALLGDARAILRDVEG